MKATGEELTISRTGFRSFEDALYDSFCVKDSNGDIIAEADTLWGIADWIQSKYCWAQTRSKKFPNLLKISLDFYSVK